MLKLKDEKEEKLLLENRTIFTEQTKKITIFVAELEIIHIIYGTQDLFQHIQGIPYSLAYQMLLYQQAGNFAFK